MLLFEKNMVYTNLVTKAEGIGGECHDSCGTIIKY